MRIYELCLIIHNDTTEEQQDQVLQSVGDIIARHSGSVLKTEKWGKKNFKFAIKKQSKGHYCFLVFEAAVSALKEIERSIIYNESILRYNFIRLEKFAEPTAESVVAETQVETKEETQAEAKEKTQAEEETSSGSESVVEEHAATTQE